MSASARSKAPWTKYADAVLNYLQGARHRALGDPGTWRSTAQVAKHVGITLRLAEEILTNLQARDQVDLLVVAGEKYLDWRAR